MILDKGKTELYLCIVCNNMLNNLPGNWPYELVHEVTLDQMICLANLGVAHVLTCWKQNCITMNGPFMQETKQGLL